MKKFEIEAFSWLITVGFIASLFFVPNATTTVLLLGILFFTRIIASELRKLNK